MDEPTSENEPAKKVEEIFREDVDNVDEDEEGSEDDKD
jgi:hypothetical protein